MSLWSEIRQRRITQVVFAYLAGGWMVLAVIDQLVDREVLPTIIYQSAFTLYLVGILGALVVGWYHGELGKQSAPLSEILMLSGVVVLALGATGLVVRKSMAEATLRDALAESGTDLRRIGVLYFDAASSDASVLAVAEGITEGLISTLAQVRELDVTSRNGAREVRGLGLTPDSVAAILDVGTIVEGTVAQIADEIRVSVSVYEGDDGIRLFREAYSWPAADLATVSSELAEAVSQALREQIGLEIRLREGQADAPNSAAWLQVARAERHMKDAADALTEGDADGLIDAYEAAEGELAAAQRSAPDWARPHVLRSEIAYERYVLAETLDDLLQTLAESVEHANAALDLEPDNASALEWRGTAEYRRWLLDAEDEDTLDRVFAGARADLEHALRLDQSRASANSTLSHLYYQVNEWAQAVLAARQAYEQDAFLSAAEGVLRRLYLASYDLGDYDGAREWCLEGRERFPDNFRFLQCQLYIQTMDRAEPDIGDAWALFARFDSMLPASDQGTVLRGMTQTFLGGIIARSGLPDSANAVMIEARLDPDLDPIGEQLWMEAAMRSIGGDVDGAVERLERFMIQSPGHFPDDHWWWDNLAGNDDFERLKAVR